MTCPKEGQYLAELRAYLWYKYVTNIWCIWEISRFKETVNVWQYLLSYLILHQEYLEVNIDVQRLNINVFLGSCDGSHHYLNFFKCDIKLMWAYCFGVLFSVQLQVLHLIFLLTSIQFTYLTAPTIKNGKITLWLFSVSWIWTLR